MADPDPRDFCDLASMVADHARQYPHTLAIVDRERRIDYATLDKFANRVAASLQHAGVKPLETIAICASTSLEYVGVLLGALRAGVAFAPLAPSSTSAQLTNVVQDSKARVFFVDS